MQLVTIGAFARATRLSPKALRLYDELGLLPPAAVDRESGYRYYHPSQVEPARLIAWLRRLGMPLARIRDVLERTPEAAAAEVAAYWAEVKAETDRREQLARFLIDHLAKGGAAMQHEQKRYEIRYAIRTDTGKVRTSNEDMAYAGPRVLAVADGMRGEAGASASAAAIEAVRALEERIVPASDLLNALAEAVNDADRAVQDIAASTGDGSAVTTLTAMLWSGSQIGLVHIGDTRAYQLRENRLYQITHDHTYVQSLVDEGRLSPEEAESHPQRALLVRALTGTGSHQPDLSTHDVRVGDRYLLCSDGLSRVVSEETLHATLASGDSPARTVARLVELAHLAGAPDNIACVVADVAPA
ncbi:MAG TPA: MerR family transcriptional regulator [Micromonosporaceae bacterium]|nr:MerR family transcriptional regulator [Micromonosporaceae bacterium]